MCRIKLERERHACNHDAVCVNLELNVNVYNIIVYVYIVYVNVYIVNIVNVMCNGVKIRGCACNCVRRPLLNLECILWLFLVLLFLCPDHIMAKVPYQHYWWIIILLVDNNFIGG